jgi:signal transduction histidine kinase
VSIEAELRAEFERWERKENAVLKVLPYFLLAVGLLFAVLQPIVGLPPVNYPATLGLTAATVLWLVWFHSLHPEWHQNRRLMGLFYTVELLMALGLVALTPLFGFFTFIGYIHAFQYLHKNWRYVGIAATAPIAALSYVGGISNITADSWWAWVGVSLICMVLAEAFSYFGELSDRRNEKQKVALTALEAANTKLEAALEENAALHAQLLVQAREAGVLDERQRMAREIHDTLAQGLAGILTQLQAAEQVPDERAKWERHVSTAMNLARESLTEARRSVHAVEPSMLAEARLPDAISDVARRWTEHNHIDAVLTTTGDARPMHADVEVTLLRTAQEALANVAKHAQARRVGLTLSYMEDLVTLDVRDDGVGFDPNVRRANGSGNGGFGLTGMRQRVQRLAGRLDIESEPGGGTAVSATVPAIPAGGAE